MTGNGAEYLSGQIALKLAPGSALADLTPELTALREAAPDLDRQRQEILADCRLALPRDDAVVRVVDRIAALEAPVGVLRLQAADLEGTRMRVGGGLVAGVVTGAVIVTKFGLKSSAKLAAEALAKLAAKKATSAGAGMLAGAALGGTGGSVVPALGTAAGAIAGGIVGGIAVWVGVDFLALKLEEMVGRDAFEADLMRSIDEAEAEALALFE